jgi:diguanylate cyclase (GGDEF)-like protein
MPTLVDIPINPVTLTFADRALETEFRTDDRVQSLAPVRVSLAAGLVLIGLLGLLDRALVPDAYHTLWIVRYALVCPFFGGMLLFSFAPFFKRFGGAILWVGAGSAGVGLSLMIFAAGASARGLYFTSLCLYLVLCCLFLRLRFLAVAGLCGALGVAYGLVWFTAADSAPLLADGALLAASAALGSAAGYASDRSRRVDFLHRQRLDRQTAELNSARQEAEQKRQEMEALTRVDALTGLASRRHFFEIAERDLERCRRYAHPLAIIMLDLDHFKVINDTCGHVTGDRVLQAVAGQIHYNVREADTAGRYGGEEFVVVLPETDHQAALQVGERLRSFIESLRIDSAMGRLWVTVSVGIATSAATEAATLDDLLNCADKALLAAKQAGRNRVNVWEACTGGVL